MRNFLPKLNYVAVLVRTGVLVAVVAVAGCGSTQT